MTWREFLELCGMLGVALMGGALAILMIVVYIGALGAALGLFIGGAVWVVRALTGW